MSEYKNSEFLENQPEENTPDQEVPVAISSRREVFVKISRLLIYSIGICFLASILFVLIGRWVPPLTSSFMIQKSISNAFTKEREQIQYDWTPWRDIPLDAALAVIAAEDQKFPQHGGFDFEAIAKAQRENQSRQRPRGASTISQQVAKNLFLWSGRSYVRKGLEVYFTILIERLWSKRRIIEVYLNIAEFGPNVYGIGAASKSFWGKTPSQLTQRQCVLLAAVLPSPTRLHAQNPSPYVEERVEWIEMNMQRLGTTYLEDLQ